MPLVCVDASFVVSCLVPEYRSNQIMEEWEAFIKGKVDFVAPPLLYVETISAIRRLASRGLLTSEEALSIVEDFLDIDISTSTPSGLYRQTYVLAARYGHSKAYDSCYLALAELLYCPLLTLDKRLYRSVSYDFHLIRLVAQ